jgi:GMP synthase (glutamine-hydrolysing)
VENIPSGFETIATTSSVKHAIIENKDRKIFGVQFHPEVNHTINGFQMLRNFIEIICQEKVTPKQLNIQEIISQIKNEVKLEKVICAVSGGVDSTVTAFLIGKAIGNNLIPVYVESGLMRPNTQDLVKHIFNDILKTEVIIIDARLRFLEGLKNITDPEIKRKTIGNLYVTIFQEVASKYNDVKYLGQGTIYSDVIESKGTKNAVKIKSHHNVGGLPENMQMKLIEPMRMFYKDEVREIGKLAGLPDEIIWQQPFPGPGYAIRIRGEVTRERLEQVKIADQIVVNEIKNANLYDQVFQCFAIMSGAFSTAVKGDGRSFSEVVAVRAYESDDIMTTQWAHLPHEVLQKISSRIVNEVPNISRVVYDITTKPPATMEWE